MDDRTIIAIGFVVIGVFFLFVQPYIPSIFAVRRGEGRPRVNKVNSRVVGIFAIILAILFYFTDFMSAG